jgi:4-amino-4-deoxy-L-arabinose transferase-like glycosyltransferase
MATPAAPELLTQAKPARSHMPFILGLAAIARIAVVAIYCHVAPVQPLRLWAYENINIALAIHSGQGFASPFYPGSGPTAFMAPLYPLLIAGFARVLGIGTAAAVGIIAFQALLSLLTTALVMWLARHYFGIRAGNLAGLIFAISIPMLVAPLYIWDTCLSALMLTAAIAISPLVRTKSHFAAAGAGCALATLVNPALLPTLLVMFAWSAWRVRVVPWLGVLMFVVVFSPWPIRNYVRMHSFIPFRTNAGYELWSGNHPGSDGNSALNSSPLTNEHEHQLFAAEGEVSYMREKAVVARAWIAAHPAEFARLTAIRFVRFWSGSSKSPAALTIPLVVAGIAGIVLLWRSKDLFTLFAIPLLIFPLPYYISHADVRFQFVIDPLLAILAGYACECFFAFIERRPLPVPANTLEFAANRPSA